MSLEDAHNLIRQAARNSLGNFSVGWIPALRFGFDSASDLLEVANIDFANQFQPALRRFFQALSENIPMVGQWDQSQTADRCIFPGEQAGG